MRFSRNEILSMLLSAAISIAIFFAQGPYKHWWQYVLPFSPLLLVFFIFLSIRVYHLTYNWRHSLGILREGYNRITALRGESSMVVRLLNDQGDIDYEREYRFELVKNSIVKMTKKEHIWCSLPIPSMPPAAKLLESKNKQQALTAVQGSREHELVDGKSQTHYSWRYQLKKPLVTRGDFVHYRYRVSIPGSEADAFTSKGGILFVECGALHLAVQTTLIAPPNFTIEILKCETIDYDDTATELSKELEPTINAGGGVLSWKPPYANGLRYVCHYRCIQK